MLLLNTVNVSVYLRVSMVDDLAHEISIKHSFSYDWKPGEEVTQTQSPQLLWHLWWPGKAIRTDVFVQRSRVGGGVSVLRHPHHWQPEQADRCSPAWSPLTAGAIGGQGAGRQLQLPPVQTPGELAQIVQAARRGDRLRTREPSPPQPEALRPHSTVVGKRKGGLEKDGEK